MNRGGRARVVARLRRERRDWYADEALGVRAGAERTDERQADRRGDGRGEDRAVRVATAEETPRAS